MRIRKQQQNASAYMAYARLSIHINRLLMWFASAIETIMG